MHKTSYSINAKDVIVNDGGTCPNKKIQSPLKRSNARACNFSMRKRTKSENGILDQRESAVENDRHLQECMLIAEREAVKHHVKMRNKNANLNNVNKKDEIVTALYNYVPEQKDELELHPGDKVRVLSQDSRDSGAEGWWVGERDSQIGVFPRNFVDTEDTWTQNKSTDSSVQPAVTPRTPNENRGFELFLKSNSSVINQDENNTNELDETKEDFSHLSRSSSTGFAVSGSTGVRSIPWEEIEKLNPLGYGAFGTVFKGKWKNQEVAIKTFAWHSNEVHIYQEAGHLSCLVHRNIVRLFGVSLESYTQQTTSTKSHQLALIMEYARGGALHNLLHQEPMNMIKLSPRTLLNMSRQIAAGMRYLHCEAHICHRDLKSSNVLIKEDIPFEATDADIARCTLLITDFGMARRTAELVSQQSKLGTLAYAAPEVCKQQGGFTVKSDVWSYGVLLWELLTKEIPYRNVEQPHLLYKIAFKNHKLYIPEGIPSILVNLLRSCWEEDKNKRPDFTKIVRILNAATSYKFLEIPAIDFHELQITWRQEIYNYENSEDSKSRKKNLTKKRNKLTMEDEENSGDTDQAAIIDSEIDDEDNFEEEEERMNQERALWQQQLEEAKHDLKRREEVMQLREAACDRAMGTMMMITVLAANQLGSTTNHRDHHHHQPPPPPSQLSISPTAITTTTNATTPVPPPRKKPFVGLFKFWSSSNHHHNHQHVHGDHSGGLTTPCSSHIPHESSSTGGNPNISHPSNLQHVVHISKDGLNFASPAFNFFPDSMKMNTWDPKTSHHHIHTNRDPLKSTDEEELPLSSIPSNFTPGSIEAESPCYYTGDTATTTSSSGAGNHHADQPAPSQLCASAPNLRKISLGNLPVFEFSSFRRPLYCDTELAESSSNHRKHVPCDRCAWKSTSNTRSATIGPSISTNQKDSSTPRSFSHGHAHYQKVSTNPNRHPTKLWNCIPSKPPSIKHSYDNLNTNSTTNSTRSASFTTTGSNTGSRKKKSGGNSSKSSKKSKNQNPQTGCGNFVDEIGNDEYIGGWRKVDHAMWSVMRMLSAVVLPDRSDSTTNTSGADQIGSKSPTLSCEDRLANESHQPMRCQMTNSQQISSPMSTDTVFYLAHNDGSSNCSPPPSRPVTKPSRLKATSKQPRSSSANFTRSWRRISKKSNNSQSQNTTSSSTSSSNRYRRLTPSSISPPIPISLPSSVSALTNATSTPTANQNEDSKNSNNNYFASWQPHLASISSTCVSPRSAHGSQTKIL